MALLPKEIKKELREDSSTTDRQVQGIAHKQFTKKPAVGEIPEGGFVIGTDAGVKSIYTKINGVRHKVALTPDP